MPMLGAVSLAIRILALFGLATLVNGREDGTVGLGQGPVVPDTPGPVVSGGLGDGG